MGGWRPLLLKSEREWLLARIAEKPDLTLRQLCRVWPPAVPRRLRCGMALLAREGLTFKKSLHASEQDRPDVARRRARWKMHQGRLDPRRLVFIDETWAKTNMTRRHGRCPRGTRLLAKVPHGRWRTLTFLAALRCDRIVRPASSTGRSTGQLSGLCRAVPRSTLTAGDIVIMDNLGSHKGQAVRRLIRAAGARCSSCRATRQTSTRSSRSSPNSRPCCARPTRGPSKPPGGRSAPSLDRFTPKECANYLVTPVTLRLKRIALSNRGAAPFCSLPSDP